MGADGHWTRMRQIHWTPQFSWIVFDWLFGCNEMHSSIYRKQIQQKWQRHIIHINEIEGDWFWLVWTCMWLLLQTGWRWFSIWSILITACIEILFIKNFVFVFDLLRGRRKKKAQKDSSQSLRERWSHIPECVINEYLVFFILNLCNECRFSRQVLLQAYS